MIPLQLDLFETQKIDSYDDRFQKMSKTLDGMRKKLFATQNEMKVDQNKLKNDFYEIVQEFAIIKRHICKGE